MVGRHHRLNGHESEQAPGVGDGQGTCLLHGSQRVGHDRATSLSLYIPIKRKEKEYVETFFWLSKLEGSVLLEFNGKTRDL